MSPHPLKVTKKGSAEKDSGSSQAPEAERAQMLREHQELVNALYDLRQMLRETEDARDKVRNGLRQGRWSSRCHCELAGCGVWNGLSNPDCATDSNPGSGVTLGMEAEEMRLDGGLRVQGLLD